MYQKITALDADAKITNRTVRAYSVRRNDYYWGALVFVSICLCLPLLSVTYAPLVDYPNHLARVHILHEYASVPSYQATYYRALEPLPNLAVDVVVLLMLPFFDILTASKIFLLLNLLLFITGCHKLGRVIHGRPTWLVLPCLFFFYNSMFFYGFVNYMLGVGVFCVALAFRLSRCERWTLDRILILSLLVFITFLAHLSAYVFLSVTLVVVAMWDYFRDKQTLRVVTCSLAPLLLPLGTFGIFMAGNGSAGQIQLNTIGGKIIGVLSLVLSYHYALDIVVSAGFVTILIILATRLESLRLDWPIFTSAAIFLLSYLLCPKVLFTSSAADARFVLPAALLFTLSLKLSLPARTRNLLLLLFLILASVRVLFVWRTWRNLDAQIAAEVERLKELPGSATVYPMFVLSDDRQEAKVERSLGHVVHYATIYRHAFVPTLFAHQEQQVLAFRSEPHYIEAPQRRLDEWLQLSDTWLPYLADYDYVWGHRVQGRLKELLGTRCTKIYESDTFSLWRVNHPQIHTSLSAPATEAKPHG